MSRRTPAVALVAAGLTLAGCAAAPVDATVVDKTYVPSSTSVGTAIGSDGKTHTVVTSDSAKWVLLLDYDGRTIARCVNAATWAAADVGEDVYGVRGTVC